MDLNDITVKQQPKMEEEEKKIVEIIKIGTKKKKKLFLIRTLSKKRSNFESASEYNNQKINKNEIKEENLSKEEKKLIYNLKQDL